MFVIAIIIIPIGNHILNSYSVPAKEERLNNLISSSGTNKLSKSDIAREICIALSKYTNWDNLFLSEHFKENYNDRNSILEDVDNISDVSSGIPLEYGDDVIVIYAEKKTGFFDSDESDNITTEYYFKYILNETGEIDDLILLKKGILIL